MWIDAGAKDTYNVGACVNDDRFGQ